MIRKRLGVDLPLPVWEAFHRIFPEPGERSAFLKRVVSLAIQRKAELYEPLEFLVEEALNDE